MVEKNENGNGKPSAKVASKIEIKRRGCPKVKLILEVITVRMENGGQVNITSFSDGTFDIDAHPDKNTKMTMYVNNSIPLNIRNEKTYKTYSTEWCY